MLNKATQVVTAAVSIALAMTAVGCDSSLSEKAGAVAEEAAGTSTGATGGKYRKNPHPKQRYDITMTIADAPGPLEAMEWFANYEASNCVFMLDPLSGVPSKPKYRMPVDFMRLNDNSFEGTVYLDAMLDEDLFGKGQCHWQLKGTSLSLKATGDKEETSFLPGIDAHGVLGQFSETTYFRKELYPKVRSVENFPAYGQSDRSMISAHLSDNDLFTIVISSKKAEGQQEVAQPTEESGPTRF